MVRVRIFDDLFNLFYKKAEHPLRVNIAKITRKSKINVWVNFAH